MEQPLPAIARRIPEHAQAVPLDAAGRVDADLPCRKCGYNLRGQFPGGICPECATAVGRAMQGDYLKFADPAWLETLASGMNWILAGVVIAILTGGGISGTALLCLPQGIKWVPLLVLPLGLIGVIGYWKVTTPDPSGIGEGQGVNARQLTRVSQPIYYICTCVKLAFTLWSAVTLARVSTLAHVIVGTVNTLASLRYSRQLALRIPDQKMARGFRIVMWGMVLGFVLFIGGSIAAALLMARSATPVFMTSMPATAPGASPVVSVYSSTGSPVRGRAVATSAPVVLTGGSSVSSGVGVGIACIVPLFVIFFGIWLIVLFFRLRRALINAAQEARATWAASSA